MEIVSMIVLVCLLMFGLGYSFGVDRGAKKEIAKRHVPEFDESNPINRVGFNNISAETEIGIDGKIYCRMIPVNEQEDCP